MDPALKDVLQLTIPTTALVLTWAGTKWIEARREQKQRLRDAYADWSAAVNDKMSTIFDLHIDDTTGQHMTDWAGHSKRTVQRFYGFKTNTYALLIAEWKAPWRQRIRKLRDNIEELASTSEEHNKMVAATVAEIDRLFDDVIKNRGIY